MKTLTQSVLLLSLAATAALAAPPTPVGAVYTSTNEAAGNQVAAFPRYSDGSLGAGVWYTTGGLGTGAGLGSQGAVVLSPDVQFLFAVDAGSNTVTSFQVQADGLRRVGSYPSGGVTPVSLAVNHNLLFVLNQGSDSVQGFLVSATGSLTPMPTAYATLSGAGVGAAQVGLTADGSVLVVTEKGTNLIDTFVVGPGGKLGPIHMTPSAGETPFGFSIGPRNILYVSEAFGGNAGQAKLSSYRVNDDATLTPLSPEVASTQSAACWVLLADGGRLALTANTGSMTMSSFRAGFYGMLTLTNGVAATLTSGPIDLALSDNSRFAYALQNGGAVNGFTVMLDGMVSPITGGIVGLPTTVVGLAAR